MWTGWKRDTKFPALASHPGPNQDLGESRYHGARDARLISMQTVTPKVLGKHRWVKALGTIGNWLLSIQLREGVKNRQRVFQVSLQLFVKQRSAKKG